MKKQKKLKLTYKIFRCLSLVFLIFSMLSSVFGAATNENDEKAFITKAELNSLKKTYQTKLTNLYSKVDRDIDNIEIEYLRKYVKGTTPNVCPYPIGAIYISTNDMNPGDQIGGTWEAFGKGRTLISYNSSDTDFNTLLKTGGQKQHTMTMAELPSHTHTYSYSNLTKSPVETSSSGAHSHALKYQQHRQREPQTSGAGGIEWASNGDLTGKVGGTITNHMHKFTPAGKLLETGSSTPFDIMQPYLVVTFWRRVA